MSGSVRATVARTNASTASVTVVRVRAPWSERELRNAHERLVRDLVDDRVEVAALRVRRDLTVGARALARDRLEIADLAPRSQRIDDVIDELQELDRELAHRDLLGLAEVDQLCIHAAAHRAPLVLLDELRRVLAEANVALAQHEELCADRLDQRGDAEGLLDLCGRVADPELDRRVEGVRAQVPPDLLAVVDALRAYEELDVVLELVIRGELRRDAGTWEALPDDLAIRLEASRAREPE